MADNVSVTPGSGATVAAEDVGGGILVQRVKTTFGLPGAATDVSSANPFPVTPTALAPGAASAAKQDTGNAALASILTSLQAQRAETLWTDDTGAFVVRVDAGGTIVWTDPTGAAANAPGTGARPAAGASIIVDASRYQANAAATGYAVGDYLSHVVTTDPATGVVIGHFWINVTTEAKLATAPASANIVPISPLPAGAATDVKVEAVRALLAATLAVSVAALPLPAGAATDAKLETVRALLAAPLSVTNPEGRAFQGIAASTIGPFPVTTTSASAAIALPTGGGQVRIANTGSAPVRIAWGTSNTTAATTPAPGTLTSGSYSGGIAGSKVIPAGAVEVLSAPAGTTYVAFKTDSGTSTAEFTPGTGV